MRKKIVDYEAIADRNHAIALAAQDLSKNELDDPALSQLLNDLEDYVTLEQMGGDYFHLVPVKNKSD